MAEYIGREDLKERFRKRLEWLQKDVHDEYSGALLDGCEYDMKLIDEIIAADVAPVVHGRWRQTSKGVVYCSNCGTVCGIGAHIDEVTEGLNFCPNCGARMDGEE